MSEKLYFFKSMSDMENIMQKLCNNYEPDKIINDDFVVEGNTGIKYKWYKQLAKVVGVNNIGILNSDYESIMFNDLGFIDTVYINIKDADWLSSSGFIELDGSEIIMENGLIRIWWD